MTDDLIKRLARIVEPGYDRASANTRRNAEITARAVLAEINSGDYAVVRAEPDEDIVRAGNAATAAWIGGDLRGNAIIFEKYARRWRAMVAAARLK